LEEREFIATLLKQELSFTKIAQKLNRGKTTINREINSNGGRLSYDPLQAAKSSREKRLLGYEKMKIKRKKQFMHGKLNNSRRIENLEMQIEILLETIKELKREQSTENPGLRYL
jgi:IS30 family transposase